ncbi:MAG: right-handed parallel beta-helix repeat-containing protein [Bacteroidales bacterium]|nr:right-handed parallel beta-helix repeat-containing protein [Bacteroidales bacterium]
MRRHFPAVAVLLMIFLLTTCVEEKKVIPERDVATDLESITPDGGFFYGSDTSYHFGSAYLRTDQDSHSGNYAIRLTPQEQYGLKCTLPLVVADEYFDLRVWKKGNKDAGVLVADILDNDFYQASRSVVEVDSNGWELIQLEFFIPPTIKEAEMIIYVWNPDTATVYFDDLHIFSSPNKLYPEYSQSPLRLFIDSLDMITLQRDRIKAFELGVLETDASSWVPGILFFGQNGDMMEAKVRLKGDWLDHLYGEKWSYRIKLGKEYGWRHMRTFSIQTPEARDFLNEWVAHRLCDQEDVLNTSYEFIPVYVKDKSLGLYAYEEHFDKHLVESRNRREGPILKLTEEAFWAIQQVAYLTKQYHMLPCFETSVIEPFNVNRTVKDPALMAKFLIAQNLVYEFKNTLQPPSELFDLDKLARYYAICDVTQAWHAIPWHNQRLYYNPVLCKLEPIVFDGYTDSPILPIGNQAFLGEFDKFGKSDIEPHQLILFYLFQDREFVKLYIRYLEKYSSEEFIKKFLQSIDSQLSDYEGQIRKEFPYYRYDREFLFNSATKVREGLFRYKDMVSADPDYASGLLKKFRILTKYDTAFNDLFPPQYVKAYMEKKEGHIGRVRIFNNYTQEILLLGTGKSPDRLRYPVAPGFTIPAFISGKDQSVIIESDTAAQFLYFWVKGRETTYIVPVNPWPYPTEGNPRRELEQLGVFSRDTSFVKDQDKVIFTRGYHTIDEFLVIPAGHRVYFEPGCTLDIHNRAGFISYSPVFMEGTAEDPVLIKSSDSSAMGFTVLQAGDRSVMQHVIFEDLNTLDYKGWALTGAVTFYESNVDIKETVVRKNHCEDAMNLIRCDYTADHLDFESTYADAFDNDFCTGAVINCSFTNLGNDAIDFSGSKIDITGCTVSNAKDKGVSGGEISTLTVRNCIITGCNIGIASKDLSVLDVYNTQIVSCNYGLVAYRKKPEYGPGTMKTDQVQLKDVKNLTWIEEKSTVSLNDSLIQGDKKDPLSLFY